MKVNLGGGMDWSEDGWCNLDIKLGYCLQEKLLSGFDDNSLELVYTSHCLEHLEFSDVVKVLRDTYRCMKKGAVLRIVLPDMDILSEVLSNGDMDYLVAGNEAYYGNKRHMGVLLHVASLMGLDEKNGFTFPDIDHRCCFSFSSLNILLRSLGFGKVYTRKFCSSGHSEMEKEAGLNDAGMPVSGFDNKNTRDISLFVECTK
ncbi:MAG: methyltransferase domain-containing protein [Lentisphaeraceae bacterium]|nr:methyltransferase domain-containing protein [Lentisphaeraceae bacterium]